MGGMTPMVFGHYELPTGIAEFDTHSVSMPRVVAEAARLEGLSGDVLGQIMRGQVTV
jgi:hypothetical protein